MHLNNYIPFCYDLSAPLILVWSQGGVFVFSFGLFILSISHNVFIVVWMMKVRRLIYKAQEEISSRFKVEKTNIFTTKVKMQFHGHLAGREI